MGVLFLHSRQLSGHFIIQSLNQAIFQSRQMYFFPWSQPDEMGCFFESFFNVCELQKLVIPRGL